MIYRKTNKHEIEEAEIGRHGIKYNLDSLQKFIQNEISLEIKGTEEWKC